MPLLSRFIVPAAIGDAGDDRGVGDAPVLPATGGGMALIGVLSMTLGGLVTMVSGRRRRRG